MVTGREILLGGHVPQAAVTLVEPNDGRDEQGEGEDVVVYDADPPHLPGVEGVVSVEDGLPRQAWVLAGRFIRQRMWEAAHDDPAGTCQKIKKPTNI